MAFVLLLTIQWKSQEDNTDFSFYFWRVVLLLGDRSHQLPHNPQLPDRHSMSKLSALHFHFGFRLGSLQIPKH